VPLCSRNPDRICDRSRYGDAFEHGNGHIGNLDTSMPGWLVADEGERTLFSAIRGPCTLIGEGPKALM